MDENLILTEKFELGCPFDTDSDGNCGRLMCPSCAPARVEALIARPDPPAVLFVPQAKTSPEAVEAGRSWGGFDFIELTEAALFEKARPTLESLSAAWETATNKNRDPYSFELDTIDFRIRMEFAIGAVGLVAERRPSLPWFPPSRFVDPGGAWAA